MGGKAAGSLPEINPKPGKKNDDYPYDDDRHSFFSHHIFHQKIQPFSVSDNSSLCNNLAFKSVGNAEFFVVLVSAYS